MIKRNTILHRKYYNIKVHFIYSKELNYYLYNSKRFYSNKDDNNKNENRFKASVEKISYKMQEIIKENTEKLQSTSLVHFDHKARKLFSSLPQHLNKITGYDKIEQLKVFF